MVADLATEPPEDGFTMLLLVELTCRPLADPLWLWRRLRGWRVLLSHCLLST